MCKSNFILYKACFIGLLFFGAAQFSHAVVPQKILGEKQSDKQSVNDTIASITKFINSGRLQGQSLAQRYLERGRQYGKLGNYLNAISDYTAALELKPNFVSAHIDRAVAFARLEKYDEAYADLNNALHIEPNNTIAYNTRGTLNFLLGKYENAATDFKHYLQLKPNDIYRMLWLYLSEKYNNRAAVTEVPQFSTKVNLDQWPGAILKLYLGEVDAETVTTALSQGVPNMDAGHICEAYFYLAQYFLLQNDKTKAAELFNKAVATKAKTYLEYEFAVAYSLKLNR